MEGVSWPSFSSGPRALLPGILLWGVHCEASVAPPHPQRPLRQSHVGREEAVFGEGVPGLLFLLRPPQSRGGAHPSGDLAEQVGAGQSQPKQEAREVTGEGAAAWGREAQGHVCGFDYGPQGPSPTHGGSLRGGAPPGCLPPKWLLPTTPKFGEGVKQSRLPTHIS